MMWASLELKQHYNHVVAASRDMEETLDSPDLLQCFPIAALSASKPLKKLIDTLTATPAIQTQAILIVRGLAKHKPRSIAHLFAETEIRSLAGMTP